MRRCTIGTLAAAMVAPLMLLPVSAAVAQVARVQTIATASVDAIPVTPVRWRGRGGGVALGIGAGLLLGGALAAGAYPYGYGPYYASPYAYGPPAAYVAPPTYEGDDVEYCLQRYKSYDPASGTYLGYDGYRHPCP